MTDLFLTLSAEPTASSIATVLVAFSCVFILPIALYQCCVDSTPQPSPSDNSTTIVELVNECFDNTTNAITAVKTLTQQFVEFRDNATTAITTACRNAQDANTLTRDLFAAQRAETELLASQLRAFQHELPIMASQLKMLLTQLPALKQAQEEDCKSQQEINVRVNSVMRDIKTQDRRLHEQFNKLVAVSLRDENIVCLTKSREFDTYNQMLEFAKTHFNFTLPKVLTSDSIFNAMACRPRGVSWSGSAYGNTWVKAGIPLTDDERRVAYAPTMFSQSQEKKGFYTVKGEVLSTAKVYSLLDSYRSIGGGRCGDDSRGLPPTYLVAYNDINDVTTERHILLFWGAPIIHNDCDCDEFQRP